MPKVKSKLWESFTKKDDGATCNICKAFVKTCGNTSNMKRHLASNHKSYLTTNYLSTQTEDDSQPRIDSTLNIMKSVQDGDLKKRIDARLAWWIIKDTQSFRVVESSSFRNFVSSLNRHYSLPGRKGVTSMINELYIHKKDQLKVYLQDIRWFCITTDGWKDIKNSKSYLGLTLHFIANYSLESVCLDVDELSGSHTADAIVTRVNDLLDEWVIPKEKIVAVVTGGAANMRSAAEQIGSCLHCIAHKLNLTIEDVLKASPDLSQLISKVKNIVTLFKQSNIIMDELMKQRRMSGKDELKVIQDIATRWNSTYMMIERYLELSSEISRVLIICKNREIDLDDEEIDLLEEICHLLKPIYEMTNDISGEKYVTISRIIPLLACLKTLLILKRPNHFVARQVKSLLLDSIEKRFGGIESNKLFAYATLLDPRFKKIDFSSTSCCATKVLELNDMLSQVELSQQVNQDTGDISSIWQVHDKKVTSLSDRTSGMHSGLKHYLELQCLNRNEDPLFFWSKNKENWPQLHNLALKYLTVQATSVPSERVFSKTGSIITDKRNRIKPKNVNHLTFLDSLPSHFH